MPPYNILLGHLPFVYKITSQLPGDAHPNYLPDIIRRTLPDLGSVYYIDTWPFGPLMLVAGSLDALRQVTQERSLPKYHALRDFLRPIANGLDLVTMEGAAWKQWRGIFNMGFSSQHLMTLTGQIVEETKVFCDLLQDVADRGETISMKSLTDHLAMDVIGRVVLYARSGALKGSLILITRRNTRLRSQVEYNPLVAGLRSQIGWLLFGGDASPLARLNPVRPLVLWYNTRRMDRYTTRALDERLAEFRPDQSTKSILDLALASYVSEEEKGAQAGQPPPPSTQAVFRRFAMNQVKLFLFSGHDTTSSSTCYLFYVLATHPGARARLRAEHDQVLGADRAAAAAQITHAPALLNQLPYTHAVIKETLRLYPAVSGTRAGLPGYAVHDTGRRFPTDGCMVWANPQTVQRDPAHWPRADAFVPERWLPAPPADVAQRPPPGAWRAFELGPRACIGQELAVLEMKVVLVMTARAFDIELRYGAPKGGGKVQTVYGERGYQIQRAQPSENLPCRVRLAA